MKRLTVMAVVAVAGALVSCAASGTWTGTSGNAWAADGNWSAAPYPQGDDTATFAAGGGAVDLAGLAGIKSLAFTGAAFTLGTGGTGAQALTWRNGGTVTLADGAAAQTVAAGVTLGQNADTATFTVVNNSAAALLFAGDVTAAGGTKTLMVQGIGPVEIAGNLSKGTATALDLTVEGSGPITLSGANNILRTIYLNGPAGGVLDIGSGALLLQNGGSAALRTANGATINGTGTITLSGGNGDDGSDNGAVGVNAVLTINPKLTGPAGFEFWIGNNDAAGTVVFNGINDFQGNFALNSAGTISANIIGNKGSMTSNLGQGQHILFNGNGTGSGLRYTGAGESTDRTMRLPKSARFDMSGTGRLVFTEPFTITGGANTIYLSGSTEGVGEIAGAINNGTGAYSIQKSGTGEWVLSGTNAFTGALTVTGGTLTLANTNAASGTANISNGGRLLLKDAGHALGVMGFSLSNWGTLEITNTAAANVPGRVSAAATVTLQSGTLAVTHDAAAGTDYTAELGTVTIGAGMNTIRTAAAATGSSGTLRLGAFIPNGGIVDFEGEGIGESDANRIFIAGMPQGPIGAWAFVNNTQMAAYDSARGVYAVDGTSLEYTDIDAWGDTIPDDATANVRIAAHGAGDELALEHTVTSVARLLHDTDTNAVAVMAGKTLQTSAVLLNNAALDLTLGAAAGDGTLTALPGGTLLSLDNASTSPLRVNADIADNGPPLTVAKLGTGPVLLSGALDYTGGTLLMSDGLTVDNADYTVLGNVVSGIGSWSKSGAGTLRLNAANTFTNTFTVSAGSVIPGHNQAFGTPDGTVIIEDGATLDLSNGMAQNTLNLNKTFIMSGFGQNRQGAVVNAGNIQYNTFGKITLAADTGFGGPARWDIRSNSPTLTLDGHTLHKIDVNEVSLVGTKINADRSDGTKGHIDVEGGILTLEGGTNLGGDSGNTMTVRGGALLHLWAQTMPSYWSLILDDGASVGAGSGGGGTQNTWRGPVQINGDVALIRGSTKAIEGNITGPGSIRHIEGITHFKGTNTYAGSTTVSNGQLHAWTPYAFPGWQSGSVTGVAGTVVLYTGDGENGWTKSQILAYKDATAMMTPHWFGIDTTQEDLELDDELDGTFSVAKFGSGLMTLGGGLDITGVLSVNGVPGSSTLTVAADTSNACTGINVSGGTMNVNGPVYMDMGVAAQRIQVVNGANGRGIMNINADIEAGAFHLSTASNATATVIHNSGNVKSAPALRSADIFSVGMNNFGYGYYRMNGGTHETGQLAVNGNNTGTGVLDIFGGTLSVRDGWLLTCWGGGNGIINLYGGTLSTHSTSSGVNLTDAGDKGSFSMVNVLGAGAILDLTPNTTTYGVDMAKLGNNSLSAVNLNAGTMIARRIHATAATTPTLLNFNGGTLKAAASGTLINGSLTATTLYDGGATIDTDINDVVIAQSLLAPADYGVSAVPLASAGANYMGPPVVKLTGGNGSGAMAVAAVDLDTASPAYGRLTGITVTAPGTGYQPGDTLTATFTGGGGSGASAGSITLAPHAQTGGLTKRGTGSLLLMQENTYKGVTHVAEGTLFVASNAGLFEGKVSNPNNANTNWTSPNPKTAIQLSPRMGNTGQDWPGTTTYIYTGHVWNRTGEDAEWAFAKSFDDGVFLRIDGNVVMDHGTWNAIDKATYTLTPGAHPFEIRFGQGGGGVGPVSQNWWTTTAMGFGYDPTGAGSSNIADYRPMVDPGDGSLFTLTDQDSMSVISESSGVIVDTGATLDLCGGTATLQNLSGGGQVINGSLALAGDLMPGGNGTVGTLTIGANLAATATYRADVRTDGASDLVIVNGNVNLSGMALRVIDTDQLSKGKSHTLLTATGTITGTIASDNLPSGSWKISYAANSVRIVPTGGTTLILR